MAIDAATRDEIFKRFPGWAFLLDIPDLAPLFGQLAAGDMDATEFDARVQNTNWWRSRSVSQREWEVLKKTSPAEADRLVNQRGQLMKQFAAQVGFNIPAGRIKGLADWSLFVGFSQPEWQEFVLQQLPRALPSVVRGDLKERTAQYLTGVPSKDFDWWNRTVAMGIRSAEDYEEMLKARAKEKFPHIGNLIDQGITPAAYFAPHKQLIADEMEIGANQINLARDIKWKQITRAKGDGAAWTLADVQEFVRKQPEWRKTNNAQAQSAEVTRNLLSIFGKPVASR